tara:strand:+ start:2119 stop:2538 length:420 start_codon:yes stop_codon:yes gene_type:complete
MKITKQKLYKIIQEEIQTISEEYYSREEDQGSGPDFIPQPEGIKGHVLWQDLNFLLMSWKDKDHPYYRDLRNMMEMHLPQESANDNQGFPGRYDPDRAGKSYHNGYEDAINPNGNYDPDGSAAYDEGYEIGLEDAERPA